jgi:hypothetical protein
MNMALPPMPTAVQSVSSVKVLIATGNRHMPLLETIQLYRSEAVNHPLVLLALLPESGTFGGTRSAAGKKNEMLQDPVAIAEGPLKRPAGQALQPRPLPADSACPNRSYICTEAGNKR